MHRIPTGGLPALLTDFIEAYEVEAGMVGTTVGKRAKTTTQTCGECEEPGPLSYFCSDCKKYLCNDCGLELHRKLKIYRGHKVYPIAEINVAALSSHRVHYCTRHKAEILKLYCETCEEVICRDCTLVEHRQHSYKFVQDARSQIERAMRSLMSDAQRKLFTYRHDLQEIEKVEKAASGHSQVLIADINLFFYNLTRSIEARRSALLKEAEAVCQKDMKQVWADKVFHEVNISHITAVFGLVSKARKCSSDTEMILTALQCIDQLRIVMDREWDASGLTNVALLTPVFDLGEKLPVGGVGGIGCCVAESKGLEIVNPYGHTHVNASIIINVSCDIEEQHLVDGRSGATISLRQATTPELKVVVRYGQSQKELDSTYVSVTSVNSRACLKGHRRHQNISKKSCRVPKGQAKKWNYQAPATDFNQHMYEVVVFPLCGGKHTVIITYGKKAITHSFIVNGKPRNGDLVRRGPDWRSKGENTYLSTIQQQIIVLGKVSYPCAPGRRMHYQNDSDDVLTVINADGRASEYNWGRNGEYEVELARVVY